jgi:hypothetical protein
MLDGKVSEFLICGSLMFSTIPWEFGDFDESCLSCAAIQTVWIKGSARVGLASSVGFMIHTR